MKLLVIDSKGMVGHVVFLYFKEHGHDVSCFDAVDDFEKLETETVKCYDGIIYCSAIINQDAEEDKVKAIKINTLLPHYLEALTENTSTVVVHRSTDCIFSGAKGHYTLEDLPDAKSFYAKTKALGELDNSKDITIRTSLIGPETDQDGRGLFNWFYHQTGTVKGFANAIWTGLTTIEFAREIEYLLEQKKHGIFQLVPSTPISKYDLLCLFEKYFPGKREIVSVDNARVDKSLVPVCDNVLVPDYETMIKEMLDWTLKHKNIYNYNQ